MKRKKLKIFFTKKNRQEGIKKVVLFSDGDKGSIPNNEYFFSVAPVCLAGEKIVSEHDSGSIATKNSDVIFLSFPHVKDALYYKIYCGKSLGGKNLVRIIPNCNDGSNIIIARNMVTVSFFLNPLFPFLKTIVEKDLNFLKAIGNFYEREKLNLSNYQIKEKEEYILNQYLTLHHQRERALLFINSNKKIKKKFLEFLDKITGFAVL